MKFFIEHIERGIFPQDDKIQNFRIKTLNLISLMAVPITLFYGIYFLWLEQINFGLFYSFFSLLFFAMPFLNAKSHYRLVKYILSISCSIIILFSLVFFGYESQIQVFLGIMIILQFVLFEKLIDRVVNVLIDIATFLIAFIRLDAVGPMVEEARIEYDNYINFGFAIVSFSVVSYLIFETIIAYIDESRSANKSLLETNKDLIQKNKIVQLQKNELELFTNMASHDLKTPVRNINSFLNLIEKKLINHNDQELLDYLEYALTGSKTLNQLIEGIASFKSLERKHGEEKFINLDDMLIQVKQSLNPNNQQQVLKKSELGFLKSDAAHIHLLFQNLIQNSLKYNKSKIKKIEIDKEILDKTVKIYFKDNGIGIDEKYLDYIFEPFKKLNNGKDIEGSGMGLYICKNIMNSYGGDMQVKSQLGKGTEFTLIFNKEIYRSNLDADIEV